MEIWEKLGKPKILSYSFVFVLIFIGSYVLTSGFAGSIEVLERLVLSKRTVRDQITQSSIWRPEPEVRVWAKRIRFMHKNLKEVRTMSDETLLASRKNTPSSTFFRAAVKFASLTEISMTFLTKENVSRFFTGDFVLVDGCPQFSGSKISNPKDSLLEIERAKNYLKHSTEDKDRVIFEVQVCLGANVFELPRRYSCRGQEVFCAAPQGTLCERIQECSMPFVRIPGQEYFTSSCDWLMWNQLESISGKRPFWPAGMLITMKTTVEIREPWKPRTDSKILQAKLMSLLSTYITDDLINERRILANVTNSTLEGCIYIELRCLAVHEDGIGIGDELDVNGGLLARFMSKCLNDHIASQNDIRYTVAVHKVDAWYSLHNERRGRATYIVNGFYNMCKNPKILFLCSKAYASLIANSNQGEELIEIKSVHVAGSHVCWYQEGALAIPKESFSKRPW